MRVIFDGWGEVERRVFERPRGFIIATTIAEVPAALAAIDRARADGLHVAGWLSYELGYALEARLQPLMPPLFNLAGRDYPLLKLGLFDASGSEAPATTGRAYAGPLQPEWSEADYASRFSRLHRYITDGDLYQANLSFRAHFPFAGDPFALYERLRETSGAPYCAYADDGERQLLSLSPELFFALSAEGEITVRPMKGTAARRSEGDSGQDAAERAALSASAKDRAENLMIVDLIRNDLGRIAITGSVEVADLFKVESYPTFHTMVSTVRARKRPATTAADIIAALFPCGSVTGAPKIRAMEVLRELESSPRGAYCGAMGWFAPDGSARFNVAIRTLSIRDGKGELGIGGGVVHDSRADAEYAECLLKARFFDVTRRDIELIETLRYDPDNGFQRIERHLARMAASAPHFGLRFDEQAARQALARAVESAKEPQRVRLTLDEAGRHQATAVPLGTNPAHWTWSISPERVQSGDVLLRHKITWREMYEREVARIETDEVIFLNERGEVAEGARSNVFVRRGSKLLTPPLGAGMLNGCLRAEMVERGEAKEARLMPEDLQGEVWFGNSLRGLVRAAAGSQ